MSPFSLRIILWALRISIILGAIFSFQIFSLEYSVVGIAAAVLINVPYFVERYYKLRLPEEYQILIVSYVALALLFGMLFDYFQRLLWWDDVLHFTFGAVLGLLSFAFLYTLLRTEKLIATRALVSVLAFSIAIMFGTIWEIFEFTVDKFAGTEMQPTLFDTMIDLILDGAGALMFILPARAALNFKQPRTRLGHFFERVIIINPKLQKAPGE